MELNKLLKRQIRRNLGGMENVPSDMHNFLLQISDSYDHFEKDHQMVERAMDIELFESNKEKDDAKLKSKFKSDFLSMMSHEIRTPLNGVIGLSNILIDECRQPDQMKNLETLKFSADLLLSLINDILDFNKIEDGKIELDFVEFDLHRHARNLERPFALKGLQPGVESRVKIDPNVPKMVIGDSLRISQIIINLAGNAVKFTHEGFVELSLKLIENRGNKAIIRFAIQDTGIGIPENKQKTIFESFAQAELHTTRKYGGTGLGLTITKKLLELLGSKIQLKSEVGVGSTFFFDLEMEVVEEIEATKRLLFDHDKITFFNTSRVLLVEDNKINVLVAKKFLVKWGFKVDTAENGAIAVEKVRNNDYDLVLMDLHMPVMDGYNASKSIREFNTVRTDKLPIIALSASADTLSKNKVIEHGMNELITKPFRPEELNQILNKYLNPESKNEEAKIPSVSSKSTAS